MSVTLDMIVQVCECAATAMCAATYIIIIVLVVWDPVSLFQGGGGAIFTTGAPSYR